MPVWSKKFWDLGLDIWRETLETVSVCWLTSAYAARLMTRQQSGLIVHVTDNYYEDPSSYRGQILHDMGHECLNRLVKGMSKDTKKSKVAVVGLNPGFMRTERVLMHMTTEARKKQFRFDLSESPEYINLRKNHVYVSMMYMGMLRRAPDQAGFDFYLNLLNQGTPGINQVMGFYNSPEYHNRFLP